jgi:anti-sigma factor RsiW
MANDRNLTCDQLIEALDDYLDGRLSAAASATAGGGETRRRAVEAHLAQCQACPALVADVRAIRQAARTLGPMAPPEHVWRHVRARVSLEAPVRASLLDRLGWRSLLQPAGAAAGLVLVVSSLAWIGMRLTDTPPAVQMAAGAGALAGFQLAETEYTAAIASLEEAAATAAPRLDAFTTATLRSSIDDIDLAIVDAREALALEPDDALSQESLLDALGSKVALLQDTVAMLDVNPATEVQTP